MKTKSCQQRVGPVSIGIDFHKNYSVFSVVDSHGAEVDHGRIEHREPGRFLELVRRWPGCRVVWEATMNWQWLHEILEEEIGGGNLVLANPFKMRVIAEAQIKTDKIDARMLAQLLRVGLVAEVHVPAKSTRQLKDVLRQRSFFVRQRTMVRNRIHRLLGAQHGVSLPVCRDLFGKRGRGFLEALELPPPASLLLKQQLQMLDSLEGHIRKDQEAVAKMLVPGRPLELAMSLPGMGPILAAVAVAEIDDISRFASSQKLVGYAGLCPSTSSSGGKTYNGHLLNCCNKWLRWAFVEAAWVAVGCSAYFGEVYQARRRAGKKANTAILATARRMAQILWHLLTEGRTYAKLPVTQTLRGQPGKGGGNPLPGLAKEWRARKPRTLSPAAPI